MKKILPIFAIILLLSSCGGNIVAKVGNIKIKPEEFSFYLNEIKTQMQGTELKTDNDWETQEIEGKKAIDVAKERAMDIAIKNALYIEATKASGIKFSSEDITTVNNIKAQIVDSYGGGYAYNQYLKDNNITHKFMDMMVESSAYLNKIREHLEVENPISDEDILEYYENNKSEIESRYRKAKHILLSTKDAQTNLPLTKSEQDNAKRTANYLLKRTRAGEDFDALMHEFSQDPGLENAPDGYVFSSGEMVAEFEECVDSIGYDEIAMCETDFGYHIVKRLPVSYEDMKQSLKSEVEKEKIDETVYAWAEEFGVEIIKYEENYKDIK